MHGGKTPTEIPRKASDWCAYARPSRHAGLASYRFFYVAWKASRRLGGLVFVWVATSRDYMSCAVPETGNVLV